MVIDNSNLVNMDGRVVIEPEVTWAYDDATKKFTVTASGTTIPDGHAVNRITLRAFDRNNKEARVNATTIEDPLELVVSALDLTEPLSITCTIATNKGAIADGAQYKITPVDNGTGVLGHWDCQNNA